MGDQDIDFRLNTQADPAGADKVIDKFDELKEKVVDLGEASEEAGKKSEKLETNDREANLRGRAVEWVKVGNAVRDYGAMAVKAAGDLDGLDEKTKALVKTAGEAAEKVGGVVSSVAQGFAAGGPLGAVVAGATAGLGLIFKAWSDADSQLSKTADAILKAGELQRKLTDLKVKLPIAEAAEEAFTKLTGVLGLLDKLQKAEVADRATGNRIDDAINPKSGAAGSLQDNNRAAGEINAAADAALVKVEAARVAADKAEESVNAFRAALGEGSDDFKQAVKDRDAAVKLLKQAEEYAAELEAAAPRALAELNAKNVEVSREFQEEALKTATANAKGLQATVKDIMDKQGGKGSPLFTEVVAALNRLLDDGGIDGAEMKEFTNLTQQVSITSEAFKNNLASYLTKLAGVNQQILDDLKERDAEIIGLLKTIAEQRRQSAAQIAEMKQQINSKQAGY